MIFAASRERRKVPRKFALLSVFITVVAEVNIAGAIAGLIAALLMSNVEPAAVLANRSEHSFDSAFIGNVEDEVGVAVVLPVDRRPAAAIDAVAFRCVMFGEVLADTAASAGNHEGVRRRLSRHTLNCPGGSLGYHLVKISCKASQRAKRGVGRRIDIFVDNRDRLFGPVKNDLLNGDD